MMQNLGNRRSVQKCAQNAGSNVLNIDDIVSKSWLCFIVLKILFNLVHLAFCTDAFIYLYFEYCILQIIESIYNKACK